MANVKYANNAVTTLASGITAVATSMTVTSAAAFPTLTGAQYFYCTLTDAATSLVIEIVKVTAVTGSVFTIVRGQDGTTASAYLLGDNVQLRLTRANLLNFPLLDETNTFTQAQTFTGGIVSTTLEATASVSASSNVGAIKYGTLSYSDTGIVASFATTIAGYNQTVLQNKDAGATSSTNIAVSNNNATATTNFAEFGINSSGFTGSGAFSQPGYSYVASASTDLALGTYGANGIHFVVNNGATDAAVIDSSGNLGVGVTPTGLDLLELGAGTTSKAPLGLTSGSLLTTADAGSVEYDGKALYFTPASTARAIVLSPYFFRKNTATTLTSATGNQSIFGLTSGVTVQANMIYEVECEFELTTTGTVSHTEAFGFTLATATVTNMGVTVNRLSATTTSSALGTYLTSVTPVVVTGALTTAQTVAYRIKGTIAFGTGGSINPVIAFSAAPTGTSTIVLGSWMKMTPIGTTGANVSIGTWA